jgi:hypothetical protein
MNPKDESIIDAGLLGAVVGLLLNGPRGALTFGLAGMAVRTAREYPDESAELLRKVLEPKKLPMKRKAQAAVASEPQAGADVDLKECKKCGTFHSAFDCLGRPARRNKAHRARVIKKGKGKGK